MKLIFALTAGRTGTAYLAELIKWNIKDAEAQHEIDSFSSFGVDTPDISHLHAFNNEGNTPLIQEFWKRKLGKILACGKPVYVETSHMLMKAGLVENMAELAHDHEVHFVVLRRDAMKIVESFYRRRDFMDNMNMWTRYLDPDYAKNKVTSQRLFSFAEQVHTLRCWYLNEIEVRIAQYCFKYSNHPFIYFHMCDIDDLNDRKNIEKLFNGLGLHFASIYIPPKQNVSTAKLDMSAKEKDGIRDFIKFIGLYTRQDT